MIRLTLFFFLMIRRPPISTLLPYPTLFRSHDLSRPWPGRGRDARVERVRRVEPPLELRPQLLQPLAREHPLAGAEDRKSTRLNSSHANISYAVFCLKKKPYTVFCL